MTWFDDNERKSYPLVGDDDGLVPHDILVDVMVYAPSAVGTRLTLTSIAVTDLVVSVVFSLDGTPACYATVTNSEDLVQSSVQLEPIATGVSGFVVFGSGIRRRRLNVTGTYGVVDSAAVLFDSAPLTPTLTVQGRELFGRVTLEAGSDVSITAENVVIQGVGTRRAAVFRLVEAVRGEPVGAAFKSAEADLPAPAVRSINGIPPPLDLAMVVIKELPTEADVDVVPDATNHAITVLDHGEPCA
ncbi:MAG TPA: hypothetical protein PLS53_00455 [Thermoanaerobaculaceae bacterium]|nr:hypothetical protein [Thermoanaerobaculaceae bacterium]